jgi:hypothetical protein
MFEEYALPLLVHDPEFSPGNLYGYITVIEFSVE